VLVPYPTCIESNAFLLPLGVLLTSGAEWNQSRNTTIFYSGNLFGLPSIFLVSSSSWHFFQQIHPVADLQVDTAGGLINHLQHQI